MLAKKTPASELFDIERDHLHSLVLQIKEIEGRDITDQAKDDLTGVLYGRLVWMQRRKA